MLPERQALKEILRVIVFIRIINQLLENGANVRCQKLVGVNSV